MGSLTCHACGHAYVDHNTGTCRILAVTTVAGTTTYPGGCGCTALPFDATCTVCGKRYVCGQGHDPHPCAACHERAFAERTDAAFAPLVAALDDAGIAHGEPWNTGGNIMCLPIPLFDPHDEYPYLLMGEDGDFGASLYIGEGPRQGLNLWPEAVTESENDEEYVWTPARAARQVAWFAPLLPVLRTWYAEHARVTRQPHDPPIVFGAPAGDDFISDWDVDPVIPGTVVSDF